MVIAALLPLAATLSSKAPALAPEPGATSKAAIGASNALAALAPRFEANAGQFDPAVRYVSRGPGYTLFLTSNEAVMDLPAKAPKDKDSQPGRQLVRMSFAGANATPETEATQPTPGVSNYLKGNDPAKWTTGVQSFSQITYKGLYPGIDLLYRGNRDKQLEYDFVVAPGADPSVISLAFSGHEGLKVDKAGNLVLSTAAGELVQNKPFVYQDGTAGRSGVQGKFEIEDDHVHFDLGDYDRTAPLIIDPVITYSTHLGGGSDDDGTGLAVHPTGTFITGTTCSSDFVVKPEGRTQPQDGISGGCDAFVTKLTPDGSDVIFSTYLGGSEAADPPAGPILANPDVCASRPTAGGTGANCHIQTLQGDPDPHYVYHDNGSDVATGIAVDEAGNSYLTGTTHTANFPTTVNALSRGCGHSAVNTSCDVYTHTFYEFLEEDLEADSYPRSHITVHVHWVPDAFVAKLDAAGSTLAYGSYLGGGAGDGANANTHQGFAWGDAYTASRLGAQEGTLSGSDHGLAIAAEGSGLVYLVGSTVSADFPTSGGALDRECGTDSPGAAMGNCDGFYQPDGFVTRIDTEANQGDSLRYSTFLGGAGRDTATAIALPKPPDQGKVTVAGRAHKGFPTTAGALLPSGETSTQCGCGYEGFVAKLDGEAGGRASLLYSTYLGRAEAAGVAVDEDGNTFVTGRTWSSDKPAAMAPNNGTTVQHKVNSGSDAFVAKLSPQLSELKYFTFLGGAGNDSGTAIQVDSAGHAFVAGLAASSEFPVADGIDHASGAGGDAFVLKLRPDASGMATPGAPTITTAASGGSLKPTLYHYALTALNDSGESMATPEVTIDVKGAEDSSSVTLSWSESADATRYRIYRRYRPPGTYSDVTQMIAEVGEVTTYVDSGSGSSPSAKAPLFNGSALAFGTLVGGAGMDSAKALGISTTDEVLLVGQTMSKNFPVTSSGIQGRIGGADVFVTKISLKPAETPTVSKLEPNRGSTPGGSRVTIVGSGFGPESTVRFGTTMATDVTVQSEDKLTATSPPHVAGEVPVVVTNIRGSSPPLSPLTSFTYEEGRWDAGGLFAINNLFTIDKGVVDATGTTTRSFTFTAFAGRISADLYWGSTIPQPYCRATNLDMRLIHVPTGTTVAEAVNAASTSFETLIYGVPEAAAGSSYTLEVKAVAGCAEFQLYHSHPTGGFANVFDAAQTATVLDSADCRAANASVSYPCGKVLVTGQGKPRLYDPTLGNWTFPQCRSLSATCQEDMVVPRRGHTATLLEDGRVLIAGGEVPSTAQAYSPVDSVEIYDPVAGTWQRGGPLLRPRLGHTTTALRGGKVLIVGSAREAMTELYDPKADGGRGLSSPAGVLEQPRRYHTTNLLADGRAVVIGGVSPLHADAPDQAETIEFYEPESNTWSSEPSGSMVSQRTRHTSTQLHDGRILVAGGTELIQDELFDPTAAGEARWRPAAAPSLSRFGHAAVGLASGKVLHVGGSSYLGGSIASPAEIYTPDSGKGSWAPASPMLASNPGGTNSAALLIGASGGDGAHEFCQPRCGKVLWTGYGAELYSPPPTISKITSIPCESEPCDAVGPAESATPFVLTGTGFSGINPVKAFFGDVHGPEASVGRTSHLQLEATSPPMGDSAEPEVVVLNDGGPAIAPRPFRYLGLPGRVAPLTVTAGDLGKLILEFRSAGSVAAAAPPATSYQVRRARNPILSNADFDSADTLSCSSSAVPGDCLLEPTRVGQRLSVTIDAPPAGRTRYYAVRAVNEDGEVGPFATASYTSPGIAVDEVTTAPDVPPLPPDQGCPALPTPSTGQVAFPAGYSLVGLPPGTLTGANSLLYSWLNQGAGGNYATAAASTPTEAGRGYWAWFSCPKLVQLSGASSESATLPLGAYRASMVGNPSAAGPATVTGHDFAARWDPSLNAGAGGYHISGYRQAQDLAVGQGMWAFSYVATDLSIRRH